MKKILFLISVGLFIAYMGSITAGCANIIPPAGGPKDTLPPVLVRAEPGDSALNFKGNTLTFIFDEYIDQPQNLQQNLFISPYPEQAPVIETRLRTLTVKLKDSLEPQTTYHFNFGNAIRDINESNELKNFSFRFTTGSYFDSLKLTGRVLLAETGMADSTLLVMLHRNGDDSAVVKENPRYIARLDGKGNFRFEYLPSGTFHIYAIKEEGGQKKYLFNTQLFAFADSPVVISDTTEPVLLYAYAVKKETARQPEAGLGFGKTTSARQEENHLRLSNSLQSGKQDLVSPFYFSSETPVTRFDSSKISIRTDSAFNLFNEYSWLADTSGEKFTLQTAWKENTLYHLILGEGFAADSSGRQYNRTDTLSFYTKKKADYGALKISFTNLDSRKNPVLQFVQNGNLVNSFPLDSSVFVRELFVPGDYDIRILFDDNRNGVWDPGDFFQLKKQPELVQPLNQKLNIKAGWENEFDFKL